MQARRTAERHYETKFSGGKYSPCLTQASWQRDPFAVARFLVYFLLAYAKSLIPCRCWPLPPLPARNGGVCTPTTHHSTQRMCFRPPQPHTTSCWPHPQEGNNILHRIITDCTVRLGALGPAFAAIRGDLCPERHWIEIISKAEE